MYASYKNKILNRGKMSKLNGSVLINDGKTGVIFAEYHFFPLKKKTATYTSLRRYCQIAFYTRTISLTRL